MSDLMRSIVTGYRTDFALFATKVFNLVNPGQPFCATTAFAAMACALNEVVEGRLQRLIITVPPRSGKSLLASIALPAFALGPTWRPSTRATAGR